MRNAITLRRAIVLLVVAVLALSAFAAKQPRVRNNSYTPPSTNASGGPDAFGYSWRDNNNEPTGPAFDWKDISTTGTTINYGTLTDDGSAVVPVGFAFPFYGATYTNINVCTNGFISVSSTSTSYIPHTALPSATQPTGLIAPFWDDMHPGNTTNPGWVKYGMRGTDTLVVTWHTVEYGGTFMWDFQAVLVNNGHIYFNYQTVDTANTFATIGIDNVPGTVGLQVSAAASYARAGRSVRFTPPVLSHSVYGYVRRFTGNNPIDSAVVSVAGIGQALTNAQGYYSVATNSGTYVVTTSKPGYMSKVDTVVVGADSTQLNVLLRRPTLSVNPTSLELNVTVPDSAVATITMTNGGDAPMSYNARVVPSVSPTDQPWDTIRSFNLEQSRTVAMYGAEYAAGYIFAPAGNKFHRFTTQGVYVDSSILIPGAAASGFTIRDMAFDGDYLYGTWDGATLRAFNPATGANVTAANISLATAGITLGRGVAYDPESDHFFVAGNWAENRIVEITRSGTVIRSWTNATSIAGLAWYPNDADNAKLYVFSQTGTPTCTISKLNTTTGVLSVIRVLPGAAAADMAGGCFISDQVVPGLWVFGGAVQGSPDRVIVCELGAATGGRWSLAPTSGSILAGANSPLRLAYYTQAADPTATVNATVEVNWGVQTDDITTIPVQIRVNSVSANEPNAGMPGKFELIGAYPNPFNPTTAIRFSMAKSANVKLALYDVSGRLVNEFWNGTLPAGTHSMTLTANDLSSGTYFVRMTANEYQGVSKVVFLK